MALPSKPGTSSVTLRTKDLVLAKTSSSLCCLVISTRCGVDRTGEIEAGTVLLGYRLTERGRSVVKEALARAPSDSEEDADLVAEFQNLVVDEACPPSLESRIKSISEDALSKSGFKVSELCSDSSGEPYALYIDVRALWRAAKTSKRGVPSSPTSTTPHSGEAPCSLHNEN